LGPSIPRTGRRASTSSLTSKISRSPAQGVDTRSQTSTTQSTGNPSGGMAEAIRQPTKASSQGKLVCHGRQPSDPSGKNLGDEIQPGQRCWAASDEAGDRLLSRQPPVGKVGLVTQSGRCRRDSAPRVSGGRWHPSRSCGRDEVSIQRWEGKRLADGDMPMGCFFPVSRGTNMRGGMGKWRCSWRRQTGRRDDQKALPIRSTNAECPNWVPVEKGLNLDRAASAVDQGNEDSGRVLQTAPGPGVEAPISFPGKGRRNQRGQGDYVVHSQSRSSTARKGKPESRCRQTEKHKKRCMCTGIR